MTVHEKWGRKYACYSCSTKFYDLNRPKAICPRCGADQSEEGFPGDDPLFEEEEAVEDEVEETEDGELDENLESIDDDMPPMQETLGYDETDVEEDE